jgi:integrase
MARLARSPKLETREGRLKLPAPADRRPYWKQLTPGVFIGYRKNATGGVWVCRIAAKSVGWTDTVSPYMLKTLGTADDTADANGADILTYKEAFTAALAFAEDCKAHDKPAAKYTVADAVADYLKEHYAKEGRSKDRTEHLYKAHILPALGKKLVTELTAKDIGAWLIKLAEGPKRVRGGHLIPFDKKDAEAVRQRKASANRILTALKAPLNHAFRTGRVAADDAWRRVAPFKRADAPKIRYLLADESARLLNACGDDFRPVVRAGLQTGCRYGELIAMKTSDFDPASGTVYVSTPKGGKPRHVPLTDEGRRWFEQWTAGKSGVELILTRPDGEPWGRSHQTRRMVEACKAARIIPAISFHDIRHTYGSALATAGVPLQMIADALGHADTRMTSRHYAHLQPSAVADAIRTHLPNFGGPDSTVTPLRDKTPNYELVTGVVSESEIFPHQRERA